MKDTLVSIVIPVFNRPQLISDAIESVLLQSYEKWELMIVDDGSTDNTWEVLENYSQKDSRIKIYERNREPKGAPTCRNIGAGMAKGKYLIFWDSDDLLAPWCLEERVKFMETNPALDFGLFQLLNFNEKEGVFSLRCNTTPGDYLERFLTFHTAWQTSSVIWRKTIFDSIGGWDEDALSWQDGEIHIRALAAGMQFAWGCIFPDGVIRSNHKFGRITNTIDPLSRLINRLAISKGLFSILTDEYRRIFFQALKARIWFETYHWSMEQKNIICAKAKELSLFTDQEAHEYITHFRIYKILRKLPLIRGFYYRKHIGVHFANYTFFPVKEVAAKDIDFFIEKINLLDTQQKEKLMSILPQMQFTKF